MLTATLISSRTTIANEMILLQLNQIDRIRFVVINKIKNEYPIYFSRSFIYQQTQIYPLIMINVINLSFVDKFSIISRINLIYL